ncbi:MAG: MFS transporter [Ignavibacteriae bacterium]|nr:MFS transporter [Ignavibacteriota bacterium]
MKKTPLFIIFIIVFVDLLGFGIVIPILPLYAQRGFGASDFTVGLLVASFSLMQLLFTPLWGRWSDRIGRRPVLAVGLVFTVIGYVLFGLAGSLFMLFASRMLAGIGGSNISAAQAYIADVTPVHERAKGMGLIGAAFGLGFVFGPVIGGLLSVYGYEIPGLAAAGLSFIALLLTLTILPEPTVHSADTTRVSMAFNVQALREAVSRPKVGVLLLLFFLVTFGYANIYATFPILTTREFGYSDHEVGYLFGYLGIVGAITQGGLIRILTRRVGERTLFFIGAALTAVGLSLIPFRMGTWYLHAVLTVLAFGSGLVTPMVLGLLSKYADPHEQGSILGINQSLGALGRAVGPVFGSFMFQAAGHQYPFFTGGAVMLVVLLIAWRTL